MPICVLVHMCNCVTTWIWCSILYILIYIYIRIYHNYSFIKELMYAYVVFLLHWMHWMHTGAAAAACFQITAQASASRWQSRSSSSGAEIWGHESGRVHHLLRLLWRNLMDATYISVFCHGFSKDLPTLHLYPCWSVFLGCTGNNRYLSIPCPIIFGDDKPHTSWYWLTHSCFEVIQGPVPYSIKAKAAPPHVDSLPLDLHSSKSMAVGVLTEDGQVSRVHRVPHIQRPSWRQRPHAETARNAAGLKLQKHFY